MRILFLSTWYPYPPDNGSKIRAYHLLKALARRHQVTLASFAFDAARPGQAEELRALGVDERTVTVPINPFDYNRAGTLRTFLSPRPMASRPIPAMTALVSEMLATHPFDAVIASTEMMADYVLMAPPNVTRVLEEHNAMCRWARESYVNATGALVRARRWASWRKQVAYQARYYPRFDLLTMVSAEDRGATLQAIGKRAPCKVVPNGVDCQHNRPIYPHAPYTLVYNGALTYSANYDAMRFFLAEVYPLVQRALPRVTLTITGSTRGVDLGSLALDDSVRLSGYVDDIRPVVGGAAACVVPLRQGGGTRLKILEAMALGTPVVSTTKGAEGLDLRADEHLLLADTPTDLAATTVRVLTDAALADALARRARALVEAQYDWAAIGQHFASLVEEAVLEHTDGHG